MNKIFSFLFLLCFIAVKGRHEFPIEIDGSVNTTNFVDVPKPKESYRLPSNVSPKNYKIILTPYLSENHVKSFKFDGEVTILFTLTEESSQIIIHSRNLTWGSSTAQLNKPDNKPYENIIVTTDENKDFKIIELPGNEKFSKGDYTFKIKYEGILHDDMRGFYRSSYKNDKDEQVWLATTHFEPVGARRAFPCFDEPGLKATFDLTIKHPKVYHAISNMKIKETKTVGDLEETTFDQTPPMSTYLLAFVVSDFESLSNKDKTFTVHARPNAYKNGQLALETGEKLLKKLEEYTGIKFSEHKMTKMDQIAIPDFAAGAMENWGLVTYREKSLLFDDKVSTTSEKQNIVETIAHEFAHQWFGDLVSPKWWKYVWLNEGFANFLQSVITEQVEPTWQSIHQSVIKSIQSTALILDSGSTTHPINQDVESPYQISSIFDGISYQKGGAVIRMMQHFLTDKIFKEGLNHYLKDNSHKAADSDLLFDALTKAAKNNKINNIDVKTVMDNWVNRKGYPLVTVKRNYETKSFEIKQERYFTYNASKEEKDDKYTWHIPINYATATSLDFVNKTTPDLWFINATFNHDAKIDSKDWLILNKQQTGFYRVNYDNDNWKLIIDYLKSENRDKIHVLNRAQLIDDALSFVQQHIVSIQTAMGLTAHLKNETNYIEWYPGFKTFTWMKSKLINTEHYDFFKDYVLNTTKKLIETVGLEEMEKDDHVTKLNRITAINWVCSLDNKSCANKMQTKLKAWLEDSTKNPITPDLKQVTLCHGLKSADVDLWKKALAKYEKAVGDEKNQLITALGCSDNAEIIKFYLNYTIADNSKLDVLTVVKAVRDNSNIGVDAVLDFIINRFISIYRKFKDDNRMAALFNEVGSKITTAVQYEKLKGTEKMDIPKIITAKAFEKAEENILWLNDNIIELTDWMESVKSEYNGVGFISASFGLVASLLMVIFATAVQ